MEVVALTHFRFAGKQCKPGTTIPAKDWDQTSETARAALINGGHVRVGNGEKTSAAARAVAGQGEAETDEVLLLQGISAKLDRLLSVVAPGMTLPDGPARTLVTAYAPAKKAKAKRRKA